MAVANKESGDADLQVLHEISQLLDTGLDRKTLRVCKDLCELGVHPETVAKVIKELLQDENKNGKSRKP